MIPLLPAPTKVEAGEVVVSYYTPEQMTEYAKKAVREERIRCQLVAEMYPFSPHVGKEIAKRIRGEYESE